MAPFERALVTSYRLSMVTFPLSLRVSEILPLLFCSIQSSVVMSSVTVHITVCMWIHSSHIIQPWTSSPPSPSTPPHMYHGHGMWLVVDLTYGKSTTNLRPRHVWPFHTVLGYTLM